MKTITFAGGCFWGVEAYFKLLKGVLQTEVGYIDGNADNPTYEGLCKGKFTHAEACKITYNPSETTLEKLLKHFFDIIDPFSYNKQGNDIGIQYRTGIFYEDESDYDRIIDFMQELFLEHFDDVKTYVSNAKDFWEAESYHQDYLDKNPNGYCHIDLTSIDEEDKK